MQITRLPVIFLISLSFFVTSCTKTLPSPNLTVHFIDIGQGDAILVDFGKTEVLIDGGETNSGAADYIRPYVDGPLDVVVATHSHADHIGGLIDVLARYQVKDIWLNGENATTATFNSFMSAANAEGTDVRIIERGDNMRAGNLTFVVLNPGRPLATDPNNNSIVLTLRYGDTDFLFTGDAENQTEVKLLVQSIVPIPDIDVLKAGHHGSRTSSSPDFLALLKPEIAVYSAGAGNTYRHPHHETLVNLTKIGAKIYGTDVHGTVVITTDGKSYSVKTKKQAPTKP